MEARNITIVSTSNQSKYVVNTDATTLAELKAALRAQNIPYEGMTFYEGLSHTELLTDESILPHDISYKGNITNELVFMLTNPNKKIKSGASLPEARQALYDAIDELGLKDACISTYGKNFTQCKNSELMNLIEQAQEAAANNSSDNVIVEAILKLVEILEDNEVILSYEGDWIRDTLAGKTTVRDNSPYSDDDIDEMFDFLNQ